MNFQDLHDRLIRLRSDSVDDAEGTRALKAIGASAARHYVDRCNRKFAGFDVDLAASVRPRLDGVRSEDRDEGWWIGWLNLCMAVCSGCFGVRHGQTLPTLRSFDAVEWTRHGKSITSGAHPPERWRQRIEDHAAVLSSLAAIERERAQAVDEIDLDILRTMATEPGYAWTNEKIVEASKGKVKARTLDNRRQGLIRMGHVHLCDGKPGITISEPGLERVLAEALPQPIRKKAKPPTPCG